MRFTRFGFMGAAAMLASVGPREWCATASAQRRRASKLRLGTLAPKNSVYHDLLLEMRDQWREISAGSVDIAVYPGGVAGDEITMLRKIRAGQMQAVLISGSGMSLLDEGTSALQVPLMFDSLEEFDYVLAGIAPALEERLAAKGFAVLGWGNAGWARFFAVREFRSPQDLRQMKLYTSKGDDDMLRLYGEFGFRAVPLDLTELQTNLETGLVEVFAVPPIIAAGYQWFASAPYMLDMPFVPIVGALLIARDSWEAIPAGQRDRMKAVANDMSRRIEASVRAQEEAVVQEMRKYGLKVIEVDAKTARDWQREIDEAFPRLRDRYAPGDMLDEAIRLRAEFRDQ